MAKIKGLYHSPKAQIGDCVQIIPPVRLIGEVVLGKHVQIGKYTYIGTRSRIDSNVTIGNYCSISRDVEIGVFDHPTNMLSTHPFQYNFNEFPMEDYQKHERITFPKSDQIIKVTIGNDVWIGAKAVIKRGVTIGNGAIIGAGAVVTKDVPPYAIVGGVPSKVIRYRFNNEIISSLEQINWWNLEPIDMSGVDFEDIETAINQLNGKKNEYIKQNSDDLCGELVNNFSGSSKGVIWAKTSYPYLCPDAIGKYNHLEVTSVKTESTFNDVQTEIDEGIYKIAKSEYNSERNCYRIELSLKDGRRFNKTIAKDAVNFKLLNL